jgi:hypothetical protein
MKAYALHLMTDMFTRALAWLSIINIMLCWKAFPSIRMTLQRGWRSRDAADLDKNVKYSESLESSGVDRSLRGNNNSQDFWRSSLSTRIGPKLLILEAIITDPV